MRKESRGPHLYFNSFDDSTPLPRDDESWRKYIVIIKEEEKMKFRMRESVRLWEAINKKFFSKIYEKS